MGKFNVSFDVKDFMGESVLEVSKNVLMFLLISVLR